VATTAPTRDIGHVDDATIYGSYLQEMQEFVPALSWPLSVRTYQQMRHDPQLKAVLAAYTLPIRRATWAVDPAGCRDQVAQIVADDLGLPILGEENGPGPARRRGVRWSDHLRLALLSLVFGHLPFEFRYEIRDGLARLVNLGERMPQSITEITLNDDGTLKNVVQDMGTAQPIPANRLLWYAHEREGSAWTGQSVLRPAYGPWLLKHEVWRVHATSIRRFGMGIPEVTAPVGGTPAQVQEAQRLASAMRAGETSGAGLPSGFTFELKGMTGTVPDALGFIRYLDQQMSTSALAGLIDLGNTQNGSRALGDSFLDLFLLSLQAVADEISGVATSGQPGMPGAVTGIVDLNWGEAEPAPRIVCTDVGRDHQLNAEALTALITAGAITPDPDLEAYVRDAWRLPRRAQSDAASGRSYEYDLDFGILTIDERRAQIGLQPLPGGAGAKLPEPSNVRIPPVAPVQASRRKNRGREVRAAGDPAAGHRQLTTVEAASGMDPDAIQSEWQAAVDKVIAAWGPLAAAQQDDLVKKIQTAVDQNNTAALGSLTVDSLAAGQLLGSAMEDLAELAAQQMAAEAASQGAQVDPEAADVQLQRLTEIGLAVAAIIAAGLAAAAGREALRVWRPGESGAAVAALVKDHLASLSDSFLRDQVGGAMSTAQNYGRAAVLDVAPEATYAASEILDLNTCPPCLELDGTEFADLAEARAAYASGGYVNCDGRLRCRGIIIATWN
jgi:hypothetical protein